MQLPVARGMIASRHVPPVSTAEPERGPKMVPDRQVQETIARCVSIVIYYRNGEQTAKAKALMVAEVQAIAAGVTEMGAEQGLILHGVEAELVARYGPQVAAQGPCRVRQGVHIARPSACDRLRRHHSRRQGHRNGLAVRDQAG